MLNKRTIVFLIIVFSVQCSCLAQNILSKMTLYGPRDSFQKCIDKEFRDINKKYRTGIKHGLYCMYDIENDDNRLTSEHDTLLFIDKHIYHVVSPSVYGKVSMIIIPYNDTIYAFIGLNCCRKKHHVEDVVHWVKNRFQNVKQPTIDAIRNYYLFHPNVAIDLQGKMPKCERNCDHHSPHEICRYKKPKIIHRK